MRVRQLWLSALLLTLGVSVAHGQEKAKKPKKDRNLITQDELGEAGVQNALQAVKRLRPTWLTSRGAASIQDMSTRQDAVGVFVDGVRRGMGSLELQDITIDQIKEIHFYSAEDAVTRLGSDNPMGAIEVISKK